MTSERGARVAPARTKEVQADRRGDCPELHIDGQDHAEVDQIDSRCCTTGRRIGTVINIIETASRKQPKMRKRMLIKRRSRKGDRFMSLTKATTRKGIPVSVTQ